MYGWPFLRISQIHLPDFIFQTLAIATLSFLITSQLRVNASNYLLVRSSLAYQGYGRGVLLPGAPDLSL